MNNSLTYSIPFSFRGETFTPRCTIDLDRCMAAGELPCLYTHLADVNRIDVYSHEYDVLMMGDIVVESAGGLAAEFVHDGSFDRDAFQLRWHHEKRHQALQRIAIQHLSLKELDADSAICRALIAAYELGKDSAPLVSKVET